MAIISKVYRTGVKNKVAALAFSLVMLAPMSGFCQDQEEEETDEPATNSSLWDRPATRTPSSSSTSTIATGTGTAARPSTGTGATGTGTTARGPQITSDDPGGNPDVPFDSNMNLAFLACGVTFTFVVLRKRLAVKLAPAK